MEVFFVSIWKHPLGVIGNVSTEILFYMRDKGYEAQKAENLEAASRHYSTPIQSCSCG